MKVATGTVIDGRIEVPAEFASEGVAVVVLAPEGGRSVVLSPEEERELTEAMEAIRSGNFEDGDQLLAELRSLRV